MILMIDDVKMVNADMFYPYVSKALAHDMDSIANGDKLYEKLCEVEEPLEIMIHDFDDIPEESRSIRTATRHFQRCHYGH